MSQRWVVMNFRVISAGTDWFMYFQLWTNEGWRVKTLLPRDLLILWRALKFMIASPGAQDQAPQLVTHDLFMIMPSILFQSFCPLICKFTVTPCRMCGSADKTFLQERESGQINSSVARAAGSNSNISFIPDL